MAGNSTKASQTEADAAKAILEIGIELLGVGIVAFAAGTSDEMGKLLVWVMLGLWVIWLANNPAVGNTIKTFMSSQNSPGATALGSITKNTKIF